MTGMFFDFCAIAMRNAGEKTSSPIHNYSTGRAWYERAIALKTAVKPNPQWGRSSV